MLNSREMNLCGFSDVLSPTTSVLSFFFFSAQACVLTSCGSPLGIGSDIGGSIRMPAMFNGIYGHKPTFNIVSNKGSLPETRGELNEFLVVGPMCKRAKDLRATFKVLAGDVGKKKLQLDEKVCFIHRL